MRRYFWLGLTVVVVLLAALAAGMVYKIRRTKVTTDVGRVEKDIRENLPEGTSRAAVEKCLDARGINHTYVEEPVGYPPLDHTEMAMIRGASQSWLIRGDIQILFKFDTAGKLISFSIREISTGP